MAQQIVQSVGHYGTHGFSASFDFLDATNNSLDDNNKNPLVILLVYPGDVRHVLTTVSRRRRHKGSSTQLRPIHFYILESPIEIIARELLLLEVINDFEVPIRQRANVFLEIFGNCKVQDRTSRYIEQLGHQLRSLVTNGTGKLEDLVDLSLLRYRERDELEDVFKSYSRSIPFDMDNLRDHRMRGWSMILAWSSSM
jgi:dynein assembly factor 3